MGKPYDRPEKQNKMTGIFLAVTSGVALGLITSLASLAYSHGATALELIALRGLVALLIMALIEKLAKRPLLVPRRGWGFSLGIGIALSMVGFGYMGAVAYITPGLAVAILYSYPIVVLAGESIQAKQMPRPIVCISFLLALFGILLCLGGGAAGPLHPAGIWLAVTAALGMAGYLLLGATAARNGVDQATAIWGNGLVLLLASLALFQQMIAGNAETRVFTALDSIGVMALSGAALFYGIGIITALMALRFSRASSVALVLNIEPLVTLCAAFLLVGERLDLLQYTGMILAVSGITLGSIFRYRRAAF